MATPSKKGCNPAPANAKKFGPRWMRKVLTKNSSMKCAMQYATIEFMPTTTRGNAHFLKPFTSIIQLNAARNRKQNAAAEDGPGGRPDAFHDRANARVMQRQAEDHSHYSGNEQLLHRDGLRGART